MLYLIVILCIANSSAQYGSEYYSEWQSGIDRTINKQSEFTNPSFPIRQYTQIVFPRRFIAHKSYQCMRKFNGVKAKIFITKHMYLIQQQMVFTQTMQFGDLQQYCQSKIFKYLLYFIIINQTIPILAVRWIAVVDEEAEIQYVQYSYEDFYQLRQGFGQRSQDFLISYYPKYPAPKVTAFIVGADIEIIDSLYTSIQIVMGIPTSSSMDVRFSTRDFCHVRSLTVAYFISNNYLTLAGSVGAYHNYFNQYLDNSNKLAVRAQKFTRIVPSIYTMEPGNNILAQGISGFDVNTQISSAYLRVTCEPMISYSSTYTLIYGTRGETLLSFMQASYVLHPPGSPYHYYFKNYDWIVLKGDQVVLKEKVQEEKKISELNIK